MLTLRVIWEATVHQAGSLKDHMGFSPTSVHQAIEILKFKCTAVNFTLINPAPAKVSRNNKL
jgi:hypothetical protein